MEYDDSDDCKATMTAVTELSIWIIRENERTKDDEETFRGSFGHIATICRKFLDNDPPMYTDTLLRAEKIIHLAGTESEFGDEVKSQCIRQEAVFMRGELEELLYEYRKRGSAGRVLHRIGCMIRPPVVDVEDGVRYRFTRKTIGAIHEYERMMKRSEKK